METSPNNIPPTQPHVPDDPYMAKYVKHMPLASGWVLFWLIFFFPAGLILLWLPRCKWPIGAKMLTTAIVLIVVFGIANSGSTTNSKPVKSATETSALSPNPIKPRTATIASAQSKYSAHAFNAPIRQKIASIPHVTADEIGNSYLNNAVAADMKYGNKQIVVSGIVGAVQKSIDGYLLVEFTADSQLPVICVFNGNSGKELLGLRAGHRARIKGVCTGVYEPNGENLDNSEAVRIGNCSVW